MQVGVSLDGPPAVHEKMRGMAGETLRGLKLLDAAGIPFRVTTVVTRTNVASLDRLVLTLAGFAMARGIGLDLLVNKGRARESAVEAPADRQSLQSGLKGMLATLNTVNACREVPIRLRERDLLVAAEKKGKSLFCHACRGESMAVHSDGRIFPCGQTLGDPRFRAGTVWAPRLEALVSPGPSKPSDACCSSCAVESVCRGDCPSRLHCNRHRHPTRVCDLYQTLWQLEK